MPENHGWTHVNDVDPVRLGRFVCILFGPDELVVDDDVGGDDTLPTAFKFEVPEDLVGGRLVKAAAAVTTPSTSGPVQADVYFQDLPDASADAIMTDLMEIDQDEFSTLTATTPPSIDPSGYPVPYYRLGDWVVVAVVDAGTGAKGLRVKLEIS